MSVVYIYHSDHEHDRIYTENVVEYLEGQGVLCRGITLSADGLRPELELCLEEKPSAVLGFNSVLDHSWVEAGNFLSEAARRGVPVLQWILDHPSARWSEFFASTAGNSRFLLNTEQERRYFETYCLPGALTATMGGVGPNRRSRIAALTQQAFLQRPIRCLIPLSLHRIRSTAENDESLRRLDPPLAEVAHDTIARARLDLIEPLQAQLAAALVAHNQTVSAETFSALCHTVEHAVQKFRRLKIFAVVQRYPVLIQSDYSALPFFRGRNASLLTKVSMEVTLARVPMCQSVLSVSPINDMIHDRTANALNGGCVAIVEDNAANSAIFTHKKDALLFRYDDDSLDECLDIVCHQPRRASEIAHEGFKLRDDPRLRFGQFHNILDLAQRPLQPPRIVDMRQVAAASSK